MQVSFLTYRNLIKKRETDLEHSKSRVTQQFVLEEDHPLRGQGVVVLLPIESLHDGGIQELKGISYSRRLSPLHPRCRR